MKNLKLNTFQSGKSSNKELDNIDLPFSPLIPKGDNDENILSPGHMILKPDHK